MLWTKSHEAPMAIIHIGFKVNMMRLCLQSRLWATSALVSSAAPQFLQYVGMMHRNRNSEAAIVSIVLIVLSAPRSGAWLHPFPASPQRMGAGTLAVPVPGNTRRRVGRRTVCSVNMRGSHDSSDEWMFTAAKVPTRTRRLR
jgi:hypothetical protein